MRIGELRQRVQLERPVETQAASGAYSRSWTVVASVWAAVEPLRLRERLAADQLLADMDTLIKVRWAPIISTIDATWRIRHNGTIYNIVGVANVKQRNQALEIQCKSGTNDG